MVTETEAHLKNLFGVLMPKTPTLTTDHSHPFLDFDTLKQESETLWLMICQAIRVHGDDGVEWHSGMITALINTVSPIVKMRKRF